MHYYFLVVLTTYLEADKILGADSMCGWVPALLTQCVAHVSACLTFVTPTLVTGDRSMVDVVAHEIAHSEFFTPMNIGFCVPANCSLIQSQPPDDTSVKLQNHQTASHIVKASCLHG